MLGNIYEAKPKYELLKLLLGDRLKDIRISENINVIIDLKQIYRKIFRNGFNIDTENSDVRILMREEIISDIIGIISHYRNFFSKFGKYSRFYFLYSESECEYYKNIYPDYKNEYYDTYFRTNGDINHDDKIKFRRSISKALKTLLEYIPNTLYIDTSDFDEFAYAKHIVDESKNNELNIILTNDDVMYQILNKHCFILNMKGPNTKCLTPANLYTFLEIEDKDKIKLSKDVFNLILSIRGDPRYSIKGVRGYSYKKSYEVIKKLVRLEFIQNTEYILFPMSEENFEINLFDKDKPIKENLSLINNNFNLFTGTNVINENNLKIEEKLNMPNKIYSLDDFYDLNNKVFSSFPLDIEKLLKGELL